MEKLSQVVGLNLQQFKLLTKMNPDESILFWYRTIDDYPDITKTCWGNLEDDSEVLEEVIDEYISGWIEEDED
jgi:hypothetical protein